MAFNRHKSLAAARRGIALAGLLAAAALSGCHPDMWDQPRYEAYERSTFFDNGTSARMPVEGTFRYGGGQREWVHPLYTKLATEATVPAASDAAFHTGKRDAAEMASNYFQKITPELLARGRERFDINCSACHGYSGAGGGIIVQRGFPPAVSLHIDRLREANDGYFFDVITNGFGRMYGYGSRIAPEDRWAIIAYIRALQHSQDVDISDPDSEVTRMVLAGIAAQEAAAADHGHGHGDDHGHGDAHNDTHGDAAAPEGGDAAHSDPEQEADAH